MDDGTGCGGRCGGTLELAFTMAFQPIIDGGSNTIWGYEALVRGVAGEGAGQVLSQIGEDDLYTFDQECRVKAIELAGALFQQGDTRLSINFMPNAVYEPAACIRRSLAAAARVGFDPRRLMFEFTENEHMVDAGHIRSIVSEYRRMGFTTALDDFGAGYAGLTLLAEFQPDFIKIDMALIRDIDSSPARRAIVAGIVGIAHALRVGIIAEGVETEAEFSALRAAGIDLFQGYLFAKPMVERLPEVTWVREAPPVLEPSV